MTLLRILDVFLIVLHSGLIVFNVLGWAWARTRKLNLITLSATAFSWFILGAWYGIGYCPLTEWHWRVRYQLGDTALPASYLKFLLDKATGLDTNATLVDISAFMVFALALAISISLNLRDWRRGGRPPT